MKEIDKMCIKVNSDEEFLTAQELIFKNTKIRWKYGGNKITNYGSDCLVVKEEFLYHGTYRNLKQYEDYRSVIYGVEELKEFLKPKISHLLEEL